MKYLLDTNVISEFTRTQPQQPVIEWLRRHATDELYLSVVTIGEIQQGISRLADSRRKEELDAWLNGTLLQAYADRILPIGVSTAQYWGQLTGRLIGEGKRMPVMDALIAATALEHRLPLVTRNGADFAHTGLTLINPWEA